MFNTLFESENGIFENRQRKAWNPFGRGGGGKVNQDLKNMTKINRVPILVIINLQIKFEKFWARTVACTVPTRFNRQSPKVDHDL